MSKPIRVRDLEDYVLSEKRPPYPFLLCAVCGAQCSASAGDYWDARPDYVFECCGEPMRRVRQVTEYVDA